MRKFVYYIEADDGYVFAKFTDYSEAHGYYCDHYKKLQKYGVRIVERFERVWK